MANRGCGGGLVAIVTSVCVFVSSKRTCKNPILPHHHKQTQKPDSSVSGASGDQTTLMPGRRLKLKQLIERKSHRAALSPGVKSSASKPDVDAEPPSEEPDRSPSKRRGHRLFGARKLTSAASLNRLKHRIDRGSSSDPAWKRRSDPWKKRRSLLAVPDRAPSRTQSPRRVPSSSSLASLSDADGGKYPSVMSSQSRSLLRVILPFYSRFI